MGSTPHLDFIVASYVAGAIIIGVLIAWIAVDYRAQRRILAELDRQGVTRRSGPASADPAAGTAKPASREQAKEQA